MSKNKIQVFEIEKLKRVEAISNEKAIKKMGMDFLQNSGPYGYTYNFTWLGRPIIQFPQDMVALQEIIWNIKPNLIIETGIAHGGSLILSASFLQLIGHGEVLGIDIDIREHNRIEIENHPLAHRIKMIEGSSIDQSVINQVKDIALGKSKILVLLDSNHTHEHVLAELNAYAELTSVGSYCIVYDTAIEDMPENYDWNGRPWNKFDNPKTAVREFLKGNDQFEVDMEYENKLLITVAPEGYLKRVK